MNSLTKSLLWRLVFEASGVASVEEMNLKTEKRVLEESL